MAANQGTVQRQQPPPSDVIVGASGLALLLFMFLPWFKVVAEESELQDQLEDAAEEADVDLTLNAWQSFAVWDLFLALVAVAAIVYAIMRLANALPVLPVPPGMVLAALGALAVLLILFKLIVTPNIEIEGDKVKDEEGIDVARSIGVFLGLLAAAGIAAGGWLAMQQSNATAGPGGAGGVPGFGAGGAAGPVLGSQVAGRAAPPGAEPAQTAPQEGAAKADWYPDPHGQARLRYWDGTQWTDHTAE